MHFRSNSVLYWSGGGVGAVMVGELPCCCVGCFVRFFWNQLTSVILDTPPMGSLGL